MDKRTTFGNARIRCEGREAISVFCAEPVRDRPDQAGRFVACPFNFVQPSHAGPLLNQQFGTQAAPPKTESGAVDHEVPAFVPEQETLTFANDSEAEPESESSQTQNRRRRLQVSTRSRKHLNGLNSSGPRNCSALSRNRRRYPRAPLVSIRAAVCRAPWRCQSTAPPGR